MRVLTAVLACTESRTLKKADFYKQNGAFSMLAPQTKK